MHKELEEKVIHSFVDEIKLVTFLIQPFKTHYHSKTEYFQR